MHTRSGGREPLPSHCFTFSHCNSTAWLRVPSLPADAISVIHPGADWWSAGVPRSDRAFQVPLRRKPLLLHDRGAAVRVLQPLRRGDPPPPPGKRPGTHSPMGTKCERGIHHASGRLRSSCREQAALVTPGKGPRPATQPDALDQTQSSRVDPPSDRGGRAAADPAAKARRGGQTTARFARACRHSARWCHATRKGGHARARTHMRARTCAHVGGLATRERGSAYTRVVAAALSRTRHTHSWGVGGCGGWGVRGGGAQRERAPGHAHVRRRGGGVGVILPAGRTVRSIDTSARVCVRTSVHARLLNPEP